MKLRIFALCVLLFALAGSALADDKLYFYVECSQGQNCIDVPYENGKMESVVAVPAQTLGKDDIRSATVQMSGNLPQSLSIEITEAASARLEKITGDNIGKRLVVVLDNKILMAPTINSPITDRKIMISGRRGEQGPFWKNVPWLQNLIKDSYGSGGRSVMIYMIIVFGVCVSACAFVLWPRLRR